MENVPGLLTSEEFDDIRQRAEELGFLLLNPKVLNTADYGVPQTRKRTIVVGVKKIDFEIDKLPNFPPAPTHRAPEKLGICQYGAPLKNSFLICRSLSEQKFAPSFPIKFTFWKKSYRAIT